MVKQWDSIDSVFILMETLGLNSSIMFLTVEWACFDPAPCFLTPLPDIASLDRDQMDVHNHYAVLAPFGKYPVNDRMISRPLEGVKVWAMKCFELIERRVQLRQDPGFEMHLERFLNATILPAIQELGVSLYTNPDICFL